MFGKTMLWAGGWEHAGGGMAAQSHRLQSHRLLMRASDEMVRPIAVDGPGRGLFLTATGRDAKVTYTFSPLSTKLNIRYD
jgi:hypothetical protein